MLKHSGKFKFFSFPDGLATWWQPVPGYANGRAVGGGRSDSVAVPISFKESSQ